ncbi:SDR family oxidoreductase [Rhodospirillales bacterium]|nr:SDR family oxidoreductase [Rhodospirillales bacterium]
MRRVLVTGGAKRIGRTIVDRLASDGWDVAIHHHSSADDAAAAADYVRSLGRNSVAVSANLEDVTAIRHMASEVCDALGPLTAVVNNASVFIGDDVKTEDFEVWDQHMDVHLKAPYVLTQELMKQVPKGKLGSVVNVIDQRVFNPSKHFPSYTMSKMALWDQTQVLARALAPNIRVNAVGPGPVLPSPRQSQEDFDIQARQTPLERAVEPAEIAAAVSFLLDAPSVTGQMIAVDSGQFMNWAYETEETKPRE